MVVLGSRSLRPAKLRPRALGRSRQFATRLRRCAHGLVPHLDHLSLVKMIAEVGTPSPLVTNDTSAPSTCDVEVPRIWRTPSSTRLKPCTYASDIPYVSEGVRYTAHTPEGFFNIQRQVDGYDKSPLGQLYRPKYFTSTGIAVHGYTDVPPYPASHGCVRVSNAAIDFMWGNNILPIGAAVWVYL